MLIDARLIDEPIRLADQTDQTPDPAPDRRA
jgi:hypothetical protein